VLGVLLSFVTSRWIQPLLFRQSATDPMVYGGVAATMIVVSVAAGLLPALRASQVDPNTALRPD
jgi:ABC-type antimicrobial peptide transport system permease subunit